MPKSSTMGGKITLHCVRHAQGYHNLNAANHLLSDPSLTPLGESQCANVSKLFPAPERITHLLASPLRRTLYTTLLSFPTASSRLPILALPSAQELSDLPCDTGSAQSVLQEEFVTKGKRNIDLHLLTPTWNNKVGIYSPASSALERRAASTRKYLYEFARQWQSKPENSGKDVDMVLVTHGGFLHYLTEDWEGTGKFTGTGWGNCEFRSFEFVVKDGGEKISVKELAECREGRRGKERELSADEQRELRSAAEAEWVLAGFQKIFEKDGEWEGEEVELVVGEVC